MKKFLLSHKWSKAIQEESDNLNSFMFIEEVGLIL